MVPEELGLRWLRGWTSHVPEHLKTEASAVKAMTQPMAEVCFQTYSENKRPKVLQNTLDEMMAKLRRLKKAVDRWSEGLPNVPVPLAVPVAPRAKPFFSLPRPPEQTTLPFARSARD